VQRVIRGYFLNRQDRKCEISDFLRGIIEGLAPFVMFHDVRWQLVTNPLGGLRFGNTGIGFKMFPEFAGII